MKTLFSFFSGMLLLVFTSAGLHAGDDKKAKAILDELSKNTRSYATIVSEYTRVLVNKDKKQVENQKGRLKVKGKKFRVELSGVLLVTDGVSMWSQQQDGGLSIKDYDQSSELNPENILYIYEKGYTYTLENTITDGKNTSYVINLTPQKKKNVESVKLYVDGSKKKILKAEIYRANKSVETIQITSFTSNTAVADGEFKVDESKFAAEDILDERTK